MAKKASKNDYFGMFIKQAEFSLQAAREVVKFLRSFDPFQLPKALASVHALEKGADEVSLQVMQALAREFLPPIEREDIVLLTHELDNVTDAVEDILRHVYMFNLTKVRQPALDFCALLEKQCAVLMQIMEEFRNFKKSKTIFEQIQEISSLEEQADELYTEGMRQLFTESADPKELLIWSGMYDVLETCSDTCEHAADVVENAVMKNL